MLTREQIEKVSRLMAQTRGCEGFRDPEHETGGGLSVPAEGEEVIELHLVHKVLPNGDLVLQNQAEKKK